MNGEGCTTGGRLCKNGGRLENCMEEDFSRRDDDDGAGGRDKEDDSLGNLRRTTLRSPATATRTTRAS